MGKILNLISKKPCLYGAVVLVFPSTVQTSTLDAILQSGSRYRTHSDCIEYVLTEVRDFYSYEIDDLLTLLFSKVNLEEIQSIITQHHANVLIDISFHHYGTFPALVFEGENMDTIHKLNASISLIPTKSQVQKSHGILRFHGSSCQSVKALSNGDTHKGRDSPLPFQKAKKETSRKDVSFGGRGGT